MSDGSLALKWEDGGCLMHALRERVDLQNLWPQEGIPKCVSLSLYHRRWMLSHRLQFVRWSKNCCRWQQGTFVSAVNRLDFG